MHKPPKPPIRLAPLLPSIDLAASGYTKVLDENFTSLDKFDLQNTGASGFDWYMNRIWWGPPAPPSSVQITPAGLVLTDRIMTAGNANSSGPGVGRAWGGGFYVEATLSWDQKKVTAQSGGPAFWGFSWEHINHTDQVPGQPDYEHFAELDFMETHDAHSYMQSTHDWYYHNGGIDTHFFQYPPYVSADVAGVHRYGVLWTAGSEAGPGSIQTYFDGQPVSGPGNPGLITYPFGFADVNPPTDATKFSIFDTQHFAIILVGQKRVPLTVKNVQLWQLPSGTVVQT